MERARTRAAETCAPKFNKWGAFLIFEKPFSSKSFLSLLMLTEEYKCRLAYFLFRREIMHLKAHGLVAE